MKSYRPVYQGARHKSNSLNIRFPDSLVNNMDGNFILLTFRIKYCKLPIIPIMAVEYIYIDLYQNLLIKD